MKRALLRFEYPESLIALEPSDTSRVMWVENQTPTEITKQSLLDRFQSGDVLVLNDTKVIPRRVFAKSESGLELEVLFLEEKESGLWTVLFPSSRLGKRTTLFLPGGLTAELVERGKPQVIKVDTKIGNEYFEKHGEPPLPPYIQRARGSRHANAKDSIRYQSAWAKAPGSSAAPTASFHFQESDLEYLRKVGVQVVKLTLHVGLGTFLPVETEDLDNHVMHSESVSIPAETWAAVKEGKRVWALGTTVARALESAEGSQSTQLLIQPGFEFKVVDRLLTNFHQPESTLLALVAGFAGLENVVECYCWAIEKRFRLFSYGDLSVWVR